MSLSFAQCLAAIALIVCALSLVDFELLLDGKDSGGIKNNASTVELKVNLTTIGNNRTESESSVEDVETQKEELTETTEGDDHLDAVDPESLSVIIVWDESNGADFGDNVGHVALALHLAEELSLEKHRSRTVQLWTTSRSTCFEKLNELPFISPEELEARQEQQKQRLTENDQTKSILFEVSLDSMGDSMEFLDGQQQSFDDTTKLSFPFLTAASAISLEQMSPGAASTLLEYTKDMKDSVECCAVGPKDEENLLFLSGDANMDSSETMVRKQIAEEFQSDGPWVAVSRHRITTLGFRTSNGDFWREFTHVSAPTLFCYMKRSQNYLVGPATSMLYTFAALANPQSESRILYTLEDGKSPAFADDDPRHKLKYQVWNQNAEAESSTPAEGETTTHDESTTEANNSGTSFDTSDESPTETNNSSTSFDTSHIQYGTEENPVTIMTVLSGEMANQLSKISSAEYTRLHLRDKYGIHAKLQLQHQPHRKWIGARNSVVECFPKLRDWDFEAGNGPEYDERAKQQEAWLGKELADSFTMIVNGQPAPSFDEMDETLDKFVATLNRTDDRPNLGPNATITLPFFTIGIFGNMGEGIDKYHAEIRDLFEYELKKCCKERAAPDEHVFHFRGFLTEMKRVGKRLGFEELSPNKTANELMAHLGPGDKVAITSRFAVATEEHKQALEDRGIEVRVISRQSGNQDFCFLMSAEKEFIGPAMSTFSIWAAYLGNATLARLYSVKSPSKILARGDEDNPDAWFEHYNYTLPPLKDKIRFEGYKAEDQERRERLRRRFR